MDFYTAIAITAVVLGRTYTALEAALRPHSRGAFLQQELNEAFAALGVDLNAVSDRYRAKVQQLDSMVKRVRAAAQRVELQLDQWEDAEVEAPAHLEQLHITLCDLLGELRDEGDAMVKGEFDAALYIELRTRTQDTLGLAAVYEDMVPQRQEIRSNTSEQMELFPAAPYKAPSVEILATERERSADIGWWAAKQDGPQHAAHVVEARLKGYIAKHMDGHHVATLAQLALDDGGYELQEQRFKLARAHHALQDIIDGEATTRAGMVAYCDIIREMGYGQHADKLLNTSSKLAPLVAKGLLRQL
jgi:hypothetical protein